MREVAKPGDAGKWETVRRLRYGDLLKLIRYRYGANGVPDDDAGRPDLMELLYLASMAPAAAEKKVRNNIELYARRGRGVDSAPQRDATLSKGPDC
jgi:hypothetical protein